ncbi:O-antigen ligase family protein [Polluticoccus soli]|uniref:O-antigen ligase family protein n=1 Tax=Polluticoccus soli TaxID=3034150 RepID=UPI0023E2E45F|nr:O-antigen ligase family protein [Flavipsychrobacter sp. JY13-12]
MSSRINHVDVTAKALSPLYAGGLTLLGTAAAWSAGVITVLWVTTLALVLYAFFKGRADWIWYCIAASPVLEVWARMTRAPLLPYELGKYFLVVAIMLLILLKARQRKEHSHHSSGYWIIGAIIPSIFVNIVVFNLDQWIFNLLGILELATLLILVSFERWSIERFCRTLQYALIPVVPVAVYLTLSASDFSRITFDLSANSVASGGFASNQVSTILGAAVVLLLVLQILKRPLFTWRFLDFGLLGLLIFRGFLTFSRGGMMVAGLAVLIALSPSIFASVRSFFRFGVVGALIVVLSAVIFQKVNAITGNLLLLRYKGETYSTISGASAKDVNTILSGRGDIAVSDLLIFKDNFVFGVGPGISKTLRSKYGFENIAAHTEFTRLLSEHGIGGLVIAIVLIVFPVWWISRQKIAAWKGIVAALFALAILTTFHAAMRTNTSIVLYALAAMPVFYYTNRNVEQAEDTVHRK